MKEMVAADSSLFSKPSRLSRQAAQGVVQALLASEATSGSTQNPGVLAAEGEGVLCSTPSCGTILDRVLVW